MLTEVVRADLAFTQRADPSKKVPRSAAIHVVVDALVSIILWWVEKYPNLPPGEVDAIFRRMMIPAIDGASLA